MSLVDHQLEELCFMSLTGIEVSFVLGRNKARRHLFSFLFIFIFLKSCFPLPLCEAILIFVVLEAIVFLHVLHSMTYFTSVQVNVIVYVFLLLCFIALSCCWPVCNFGIILQRKLLYMIRCSVHVLLTGAVYYGSQYSPVLLYFAHGAMQVRSACAPLPRLSMRRCLHQFWICCIKV